MRRFQDRTAVITGAAKGIGEAAARAFIVEGARVALLDVDDSGGSLAGELGGEALFVRCDVSRADDIRTAFARSIERFGGVDILVNNAGVQRYGTVTGTTEAQWDEVMGVNLKSAFLCAQQAIPSMLERGAGVIVNVASVQSFITQHNVAAYTTSKTALLGLTRSIAVDYAPHIRCTAVCPGTVDTPMLQWAVRQSPDPEEVLSEVRQMHPLKRIASAEEIASLILYLCSDQAAFMTGQAYRIDGGLGLSIGGSVRE